jgi:hypothetical protein
MKAASISLRSIRDENYRSPKRAGSGRAARENSRFKIQDPSLQKSLPEKQQITILYYAADLFVIGAINGTIKKWL